MRRRSKNFRKKMTALFLSMTMLIGMFTGVYAADNSTEEETAQEEMIDDESVLFEEELISEEETEWIGEGNSATEEKEEEIQNEEENFSVDESEVDDSEESELIREEKIKEKQSEAESNPDIDETYGLYGGNDGQDSMNDPETAGSSVGWDMAAYSSISGDSSLWWIDDYYVGESSQYDVTKTDDFSLKYQIEFHANEDLEAGSVTMVMDASLGTYRNGNNILPTDFGIPYGTPDDYTETSSSPFNYYYVDGDGNVLTESQALTASEVYLVIWNYKLIESGSNAMFQVLYKELDVMQIPDMTSWSLDLSVSVDLTVDGQETTETVNGNTLTGLVDTEVKLTSVTKSAYSKTGVNYTPELYTQSQVSSYIDGEIPDPYASNFDDYIYIVWQVSVKGTATQAYTISVYDETDNGGSVVGYKTSSSTDSWSFSDDANSTSTSTQKSYSSTLYVVTAYPKDSYTAGDTITNTVTFTVHPSDGYDEDLIKSATATSSWHEYEWNYEGNTVGIKKYAGISGGSTNKTYSSYETLYEIQSDNGKDTGEFFYYVNSTNRGYELTHYISGSNMGQYIEGSYYTTTTVDDALYVYVNGASTPSQMLTKNDYYFSSVKIVTTDNGYDVWEDTTSGAEDSDSVDQSVYIYAMFYDESDEADTDGWEYVASVPFSTSGTMTYTFSNSDLARQPYRVKAVHSSINYASYCTITLGVTLRADSPILTDLMADYGENLDSIRIENLAGVAAEYDGSYIQDTSVSGSNYSEQDTVTGETLEEFTQNLYGTILMRDNASSTLTGLVETANSFKNVTTENDAANSRVLANYYITAYEGYTVSSTEAVEALKEAGIYLPSRNDVTFYDLLPYGMQYNGSVEPVAGRITSMNSTGTWKTNTGAWSASNVTVTVEENDIISNWNDTGRTMVQFHIHYDGDDASAFYSTGELWYEGFGIYFQAYYGWEDMGVVDEEYNIAAYVVENVTKASEQLLGGHDTSVWKDDGSLDLSIAGTRYEPFLVFDLNEDGVTEWYTNMYASTITTTDAAVASNDNLSKSVRADSEVLAEYGKTAIVGKGMGYTYEISLRNATGGTLSNIVLFDRLEYSVEDGRNSVETSSSSVFTGLDDSDINNHWEGEFAGLTLTALDDLGIDYTVWYNTNRGAVISSDDGSQTPSDILTSSNGWVKADSYTGNLSDVKAIAIDLGSFTMDEDTSLSIQIHMVAPEESDVLYAFNNASYYSISTDSTGNQIKATDAGNTVRVELGDSGILSVEKEFAEGYSIPSSMQNEEFTFTLTRGDSSLANQEYTVYEWDGEDWITTGIVRATNANGEFVLKAGQKAVFTDLVDVENVLVEETENPYWKLHNEEVVANGDSMDYVFENRYRSPAYLYKTVKTTDLATEEEIEEAEFTFLIEVDFNNDGNYTAWANQEVLFVDAALTNGNYPNVIGYGWTDDNGYITIGIGDIIAFFPEDQDGNTIGVNFRITEVNLDDDWFTYKDSVNAATSNYGKSSTITNYYKYRNLILTKELSDYTYDDEDCTDEWTFKLTDSNGNVVTGNHWYMIDADGNAVEGVEGYLDSNGEFAFTGAGNNRRVVIERLVFGEKYTLTETNYDATLYELINSGSVSATMPTYSISKSVSVTNEYLLRNLNVRKIALSENENDDVSQISFTFTLYDGDGQVISGASYTIDGDDTVYQTNANGQFTVHGGQTAVFDDIGYYGDAFIVSETADSNFTQMYPANGEDGSVTLNNDGGEILFINGNFENVASITKKLDGIDDVGKEYVQIIEEDNQQETIEHPDPSYAFAVYSEDDYSLTFYAVADETLLPNESSQYKGKTVTNLYTEFTDKSYSFVSSVPWYSNSSNILSVKFDQSFSKICPISTAYWFCNFTNCTVIDLTYLDTSEVKNMTNMFYNCSKVTVLDIASWDTSSVSSGSNTTGGMSYMFYGCSSLKSLDLSGWDISRVASIVDMFYGCSALTELKVGSWDTSSISYITEAFHGCSSLTELDVADWDVTHLSTTDSNTRRSMYGLFNGCSSLETLNLSKWDTSNVTSMAYMFDNCKKLTELDVSNFDTSKVTNMSYMFYYCSSLEELDVSHFDTSKVTNMSYMFYYCSSLEELDVSNFDTSNVTNMGYMFYNCSSLEELDVSNFDTSNVTNMEYMFYNCSSLEELDVSNFDTSNVTNMGYMFCGCSHLLTIYSDDDNFVTTSVDSSSGMFTNCTQLTGGNGTLYSSSHTDSSYAHVDSLDDPGYFTDITDKPSPSSVKTSTRDLSESFLSISGLTESSTESVVVDEMVLETVSETQSDSDTDYMISTYSLAESNIPELTGLYSVDVTIMVYNSDGLVTEDEGTLETYPSGADYTLIYISKDGNAEIYSYNGGSLTFTIFPYEYLYIAGLGDGEYVKAVESASMERIIYTLTEEVYEQLGSNSIMSEGVVMEGTAYANESITLLNAISTANKPTPEIPEDTETYPASEIYKLMTDSSSAVPSGSTITFLVEVYDEASGTWSPASGIRYIIFDGYYGDYNTEDAVPISSVLLTGSDGKITLTKTDNGYPFIRFVENEVYANVWADMEDGALRIIELSSESDNEWGMLVNYGDEDWSNSPGLNVSYADTFYNGNDEELSFMVEKIVESDSNDTFTFTLVHILSSAGSVISDLSDVNDYEAGADVYYMVYDSETGAYVTDGYTDSNGKFTLQANQYAVFYVPDGTAWYVYEGVTPGYILTNVDALGTDAFIVEDTIGVLQEASPAYLTYTITLTLTDNNEEPIEDAVFTLYKDNISLIEGLSTDSNGQIVINGLTAGEYSFEQISTPDNNQGIVDCSKCSSGA